MNCRISALKKAAIFYRVANYFLKVFSGILSVVMIGLDSVLVGGGHVQEIAIIVLVMQCFNTFFLVSDSVIQPATKSTACSQAAKLYDQLVREMTVKEDEYRNTRSSTPRESYLFEAMTFSAREQQILESEPLLIFFGTGKNKKPQEEQREEEFCDDEIQGNKFPQLLEKISQLSDSEISKLIEYIDLGLHCV
jgi:hypothetical protein